MIETFSLRIGNGLERKGRLCSWATNEAAVAVTIAIHASKSPSTLWNDISASFKILAGLPSICFIIRSWAASWISDIDIEIPGLSSDRWEGGRNDHLVDVRIDGDRHRRSSGRRNRCLSGIWNRGGYRILRSRETVPGRCNKGIVYEALAAQSSVVTNSGRTPGGDVLVTGEARVLGNRGTHAYLANWEN